MIRIDLVPPYDKYTLDKANSLGISPSEYVFKMIQKEMDEQKELGDNSKVMSVKISDDSTIQLRTRSKKSKLKNDPPLRT